MTNTIYLFLFLLSLTLSSCGGGEHSATDTGSASFGLTFEQTSAPAEMKLAPSAAPVTDICSSYGIDSISGTVYNSSNTVIATGGPWACSAHQGTINNIPPGSNLKIAIQGTVSGSVVWQGETTGKTIYSGQDTNIGSIPMTYTGSDTTRPTIIVATPTGDTVPLTSPITVAFSESMASSTIDTTTFTLKNGSVAVSGSVSYNSTTKTVTFTPTSILSNSVIYTATVSTDVTDIAANKMQNLYTWDFTTEAPPSSAPTTPTSVTATAADKQVMISWTAVSGATSYNIYWSTTSGVTKSNGTPITGVTNPYIHTGRTNGATYYYVVTAVNSYGESSESSQVSATPSDSGLTAEAGDEQVSLSWTPVAGTQSYNIYYSTSSNLTTTTGTKKSSITSTNYTVTGLTTNTTYYFILTSVSSGGESTASSPVSCTTNSSTPTGFTATAGDGQVSLSWNAVTGATSYKIYYSTSPGVTTANGSAITDIASANYTFTGLTNDTTYYFIVTSVGQAGESTASGQESATPLSTSNLISNMLTTGDISGAESKIEEIFNNNDANIDLAVSVLMDTTAGDYIMENMVGNTTIATVVIEAALYDTAAMTRLIDHAIANLTSSSVNWSGSGSLGMLKYYFSTSSTINTAGGAADALIIAQKLVDAAAAVNSSSVTSNLHYKVFYDSLFTFDYISYKIVLK